MGTAAIFINGELWGRVTVRPGASSFPAQGSAALSDQLYEAALKARSGCWFECFAWRFKALAKPGLLTGLFFIGYGASRFVIEYVREPDAHIGFIDTTMGQILSLPMMLAGAGLFIGPRTQMTPLKKILIEEISANGPTQLADYMARALSDPSTAIHAASPSAHAAMMAATSSPRRKPPNVRRINRRMVGRFMAPHGTTADFCGRIGAGRGTLMGDILRAANVLPDSAKRHRCILLKPATLRAAQKQAVLHRNMTTTPPRATY